MGLCKLNGQVSLGEKSEAEFEECYLITSSSSSSSSSSLMSCKSSFLFSSQNLTCVLCQRLRIAEIDLVDAPPRENSCPPNKQKIHNVEGGTGGTLELATNIIFIQIQTFPALQTVLLSFPIGLITSQTLGNGLCDRCDRCSTHVTDFDIAGASWTSATLFCKFTH